MIGLNRYMLLLLLAAMLASSGCTGDKGKELFETAQFEETQHNREHALQLYREIIKKYPGTGYAEKAGKRIAGIGQAP
jgi:outer membrane protein assembly factor BamD (BamD/ComL family)